jgi:hypothetical protein
LFDKPALLTGAVLGKFLGPMRINLDLARVVDVLREPVPP